MYELTPERLQSIAVKCASQFMTKQSSLNEAICKEAMELELNPEQIKRVVETTNTLTHLRKLAEATDRTFEFPLADYNGVMASMVMPEKRASEEDEKDEKEDKDEDKKDDKFVRQSCRDESETLGPKDDKEGEQEKRAMLSKEMFRCSQVLEKMAYDKEGLKLELLAAAKGLKKDAFAFEKVAEVTTSDDFDAIIKLCGIEKKAEAEKVIFTDKELLSAHLTYSLYKQAKEVLLKEAQLREFVDRATSVLFSEEDLEKRAGLFGVVGSGIGRAAGAVVNGGILGAKKLAGAGAAAGKGLVKNMGGIRNAKGEINWTSGVIGGLGAVAMGTGIAHKNDVWNDING